MPSFHANLERINLEKEFRIIDKGIILYGCFTRVTSSTFYDVNFSISNYCKELVEKLTHKYYLAKKNMTSISVRKRCDLPFRGQPVIRISGEKIVDLNCSISHCANWVSVCLSSSSQVGVDVEHNEAISRSVAEHVFIEEELILIDYFSVLFDLQFINAATLLWTLKESFLKAMGIGFFYGINSVTFYKSGNNFSEIGLKISHRLNSLSILFKHYICFWFYVEDEVTLTVCALIPQRNNI